MIHCDTPYPNKKHSIVELSSVEFLCPNTLLFHGRNVTCDCCYPENTTCNCCFECFNECTCYMSAYSLKYLMDCSSRNISIIPSIQPATQEMYLQSNYIETINKGAFTFEKTPFLKRLYLQNNRIHLIEKEGFRNLKQLRTLWLHTNKLTSIDFSLFHNMSSLEALTLHDNPWECDCTFGPAFKEFVLENNERISNASAIYCINLNDTDTTVNLYGEDNKTALEAVAYKLLKMDFSICKNATIVRMTKHTVKHSQVGLVSMAAIVVFLACLVLGFYKNMLLMKVWAYNHCGARCRRQSDEDGQKPFDVFLAYARADERFAIQDLLEGLEKNEMSYRVKICQSNAPRRRP